MISAVEDGIQNMARYSNDENAMISAVKDGTQNMARYFSDVNAKMSALVSAVATLKNAFGALAAPIISAVGPTLTYLINMLTAAINKPVYIGTNREKDLDESHYPNEELCSRT